QLSLARLSCCEGCAPDLSVAPVGPTQSTDPTSTSIHIDIEPITATSILGNKRIQYSLRTSATGTTLHTYDALELLDGVSAADVTATEIPPCEEGEVHLIGVMNQLDGSLAAVGLLLDDGLVVGHAQLELLDRQGLPHDNTRVYLCSRGLNHWGDRRVSLAESGPRAFAEIFVMQDMDADGLTDLIAAPRFADRDPQVGWPLLLSGDGRGGFLPAQPLHSTSAYALTPLLGSPPLSQQPLPTSQGPRETHGPRNTLEGSQTFHLKVQTR
ncbi:MAG TPA: hypothetical protein PK095_03530, partial [Myxococcota bacterium]|nr:hypothetical protein [Myxococcota bacterium]